MDPDGTGSGREVLASHYQGSELNSPNDVVCKSDGAIYFTDPTYGRMPGFGLEREQELDFQGVYRIAPEGGDPQLVVGDFASPTGCASRSTSRSSTSTTPIARTSASSTSAADGSLENGRVFADGIGTASLEAGDLVDGMKLDERGNIWVTGPGGVCVFSPEGEHLGTVEVPEPVGNLNWGGPSGTGCSSPRRRRVYRITCKVSGNRLPYMR